MRTQWFSRAPLFWIARPPKKVSPSTTIGGKNLYRWSPENWEIPKLMCRVVSCVVVVSVHVFVREWICRFFLLQMRWDPRYDAYATGALGPLLTVAGTGKTNRLLQTVPEILRHRNSIWNWIYVFCGCQAYVCAQIRGLKNPCVSDISHFQWFFAGIYTFINCTSYKIIMYNFICI